MRPPRTIVRPARSAAATVLTVLVAMAAVVPAPAAAAPAPGSAAAGRTLAVTSDDGTPSVIAEPSEVLVPEGSSGSFSVRLSHPPAQTVYLGMRFSGTGIWASPPIILMFSPTDWSAPKWYGMASVSDTDTVDDVVVVTLSAPGYLSDTVVLRQVDDD